LESERYAARLAASSHPIDPLPPPGRRAALWLTLSAAWVAVVLLATGPGEGLLRTDNARAVVEFAAALATAILAALAAFQSVVPGTRRNWTWLALIPAGIWFAVIGQGVVADFVEEGRAGIALHFDSACIPPMILAGLAPALAMVLMLRRGAPLRPRVTLMLAALATGALANASLHTVHGPDASIMTLVWHFGLVAGFAGLSAMIAPLLLSWRRLAA